MAKTSLVQGLRRAYQIARFAQRRSLSSSTALEIWDLRISRRHCSLALEGEGHRLTDLGAANGTVVNDARLPRQRICPSPQRRLDQGKRSALGVCCFLVIFILFLCSCPSLLLLRRSGNQRQELLLSR